MEKCNKYDIYLWIVPQKSIKPKQMQKISLNFTYTILQLYNSLYKHLHTYVVSQYVCIWEPYQSEFFLSSKLNVVFHLVHSASSAPTRLSSRSTPKSKSESTLWSHVQSHMHYFACLAIWVFRRKGQKINVDRAVISEQATGSFHPNNVLHFHILHLPLWFRIVSLKIYAESLCPAP